MNKGDIKKGITAGFVGTLAMSAIMIVKKLMGVKPSIDPIGMITDMVHEKVGLPETPIIGWVMHFMIGAIVFGILYSIINSKLKGPNAVKGITLGLIAWLMMIVVVMPMSGAGLFGLSLDPVTPVLTLMLHVVYGAVLGTVYGKLC